MVVRTRWVAVLAVASVVLGSAAVGADSEEPEEYVPTFIEQEAWFHANPGPIGNLDAREGRYVRWDDEEPSGPVPAVYHGNNYGGIVEGDHVPEHFFTAAGTFSGDLDTIAFDLYFYGWAQSTIGCGMSLSFDFRIDDEWVLYQDFLGSEGIHYEEVSDTLLVARFALTNIWEATERFGLAFGEDVEHEVYVNIQNFYLCNEFTWFFDSEDAPSSLYANLEDPAAEGYFEIDVLNPPPPLDG
jgi:hypothetical protein